MPLSFKLAFNFLSLYLLCVCLVACSNSEILQDMPPKAELPYDIPLADFTNVAEKLVAQAPNGLAIGEVHGQLAGIMLLDAVIQAAKETHQTVLVLHEFAPSEIGLDLATTPRQSFETYVATDANLPFWTDNIDKRATHELWQLFIKISKDEAVELSYLMDTRLNPLPNRLKAHGFAKRWEIAKKARPQSYIVSLSGNYHTSSSDQYDLDVTNSLCRYAYETLGMMLTCITVDNSASPNENCQDNQEAALVKGEDVFLEWDYVVYRPDRCVVQAHWVNAQ